MELVPTIEHERFQKQISMLYSRKIKRAVLGGLVASVVTLSGCNQGIREISNPIYVDYLVPVKVRVALKGKNTYGDVEYHIDHVNRRIYNTQYLPFGTKLDSALLRMVVSSDVKMQIQNLSTSKTVDWNSRRGDSLVVDISGGKLMLNFTVSKNVSKAYELRILSYGYDPNKLTWKKTDNQLPKAFTDTKVVTLSGKNYLIGRVDDTTELYTIRSYEPFGFVAETATAPSGFRPSSVVTTGKGTSWGLTDAGELYRSTDLRQWTKADIGAVKCTMVLFEPLSEDTGADRMVIIGKEGSQHSFYIVDKSGIVRGNKLPEGFPVEGAYVHAYTISGVRNAVVLGGKDATGMSVGNSYFTSDGISWAPTPYGTGAVDVPMSGGLYLPSSDQKRLFLIGGEYPSGVKRSALKVSDDNGLTWTTLTKDQTLGDVMSQRVNAAGVVEKTTDGDVTYILGGVVNGRATREIWRGWLDKSGGIINAFEK